MTQSEILDILRDEQNKWFSYKDMIKRTGLSRMSVMRCLKILAKTDAVVVTLKKRVKHGTFCAFYKYKV